MNLLQSISRWRWLLLVLALLSCAFVLRKTLAPPVDIDLEKMLVFGVEPKDLTVDFLRGILGEPSRLLVEPRKGGYGDKIEAAFYDKGIFFHRLPLGREKRDGMIVDSVAFCVTVFLSESWDGVPNSLYSPFKGRLSKGLDGDKPKTFVERKFDEVKNVRGFGQKNEAESVLWRPGDIQLWEGTVVEKNWGPSEKWKPEEWEMANSDSGVDSGRIAVIKILADHGVAPVFYEKATEKIKWVDVGQYIAYLVE